MAKITVEDVYNEQKRQNVRYNWIKNLSEEFDKDIMYKYFEANTNNKTYIEELKERGVFEKEAKRWWVGNMFATMEKGVYDENTFTKEKYISFKEEVELPRIKELRLASINWVHREMARKNPALYEQLNEVYGADWQYAEYMKHTGDSNTIITVPSRVGFLKITYDPSTGTFTVDGVGI